MMRDSPDRSLVPLMTREEAQDLARAYGWAAKSCAEAGMARDAAIAERDSQWFLATQ